MSNSSFAAEAAAVPRGLASTMNVSSSGEEDGHQRFDHGGTEMTCFSLSSSRCHFSDAVIDYQLNLSLPFNSRVHADVASHIPPQVREAQKQWLRAEQGPSSIRDISGS